MKKEIKIPIYIKGKYIYNNDNFLINDINNSCSLNISKANKWDIEAAIETASRTQNKLKDIKKEEISEILRRCSKYFLNEDNKNEIISMITGSPITFIKNSIEEGKDFCKNSNNFLNNALDKNSIYINSSPTVCILPSNSEIEVPYVLSQILLSQNSAIIKPSSRGACSFTAYNFINAWNKALDEIKNESFPFLSNKNKKELSDGFFSPLRNAISIINTNSRDYLEQLSINKFNYVVFGSENAINNIEEIINNNIKNEESYFGPRKIIGYGTGLSKSIVFNDANLKKATTEIMNSVCINTGNECIGTDIIYVENSIYNKFLNLLKKEGGKYLSGHPLDQNKNGIVTKERLDYIVDELEIQGKKDYLNLTKKNILNPSIIPIHSMETAQELPGPVVYFRNFSTEEELIHLIQKDNVTNKMGKNLVTSIYTSNIEKNKLISNIQTHKIYFNKPTHSIDLQKENHQGKNLLIELSDKIDVYK
ncbi:MAG: aldehyde dehydrogenase family protein [Nanoarchaeota archaeon]